MPKSPFPSISLHGWSMLPQPPVVRDALDDRPPEPIPEDWVSHQLFDVDLDDDAQVLGLLEQWGEIPQPYYARGRVPAARRGLLAPAPPGYSDSWLIGAEEHRYWWEDGEGTLEDSRWWLKTARAVTRAWHGAESDGADAEAWQTEGFEIPGGLTSLAWFAEALNIGLRPFQPTISFGDIEPLPVSLYSAACLQVFNFIARGDLTTHRCEHCQRPFVYQQGVAKHGQHHSTGVRFCTRSCMFAAKQRRYREAKKGRDESGQVTG